MSDILTDSFAGVAVADSPLVDRAIGSFFGIGSRLSNGAMISFGEPDRP